METPNIKYLGNDELNQTVKLLRNKECEAISDLVLHLSELDIRGYYRDLGYSSLYSYCTTGLGYSEGAAQRRIQAARVLRDYPQVYFKLRTGVLSLCTVSEVAKAPPPAKESLLKQAEGKSKRQVEQIVAAILPSSAAKKEVVRVKYVKTLPPPVVDSLPLFKQQALKVEERYCLTLEVDKEFMELLERSKIKLGRLRNGELLKKALKSFVAKGTPKRKIRLKVKASKDSRYIPKATRELVLARNNHRCSYTSPAGHRCAECCGLQIDHIVPIAKGGTSDLSNLRTLCHAHNQLFAEREFGRSFMNQHRHRNRYLHDSDGG